MIRRLRRPRQPGGWRAHANAARTAAEAVWAASPTLVGGLAAVSVAAGLIPPVTAWLQRDLLDALVSWHAARQYQLAVMHGLLPLVVAIGALGVVAAIVPQGQQYIQATLRRAVAVVVTDRAYRAVCSWPGIARFESPAFADKLQLTNQLSQATASSLITAALGCAQASITAVTFMISLILINPLLAAAAGVSQSLAIAAGVWAARKQARLQLVNSPRARRQQSYSRLLSDAIAAKEVRLFGLGGFLSGRMLAELRAIRASEAGLGRRLLAVEACLSALSAAVIAAGIWWIVMRVAAGRLPLGDVTLFVMAALGMQGAMNQIAAALGGITQSVLLFGAYADVVSAPPDLPLTTRPADVPPLRLGISIDDVWFRYDESHPWVLRGAKVFIPAGCLIALVGLNGSGKSTLVKLLCRLYDPVRGSIRWDGVDIRDFDPVQYRQRIAGVFQDYMSYDLTVSENIGMGDLDALDDGEVIRRAAELAGAAKDIERLPHGYDTMISRVFSSGARNGNPRVGVSLSGGQRQRLALARAFMRLDRDLLIVDEPMSSLDAQAEYEINRKLAQVHAGRTCVLISHRLASVREAGHIVVLADGKVAEQGTHAELMAVGGRYARLFELQAAGYRTATAGAPPDGAKAPR